MQLLWPQIIMAAEAQQRARNDALSLLLTGQTFSGAAAASVTMGDDDVRLLFADTMLGPRGALRPKAGESARDLFDQARPEFGADSRSSAVNIAKSF